MVYWHEQSGVSLKSDHGQWKKVSLLLSTDIRLSPQEVIESYRKRWSIESMFNQLKLSWGLKEVWQQTRQTLHRWVHITKVGNRIRQGIKMGKGQGAVCNSSDFLL